VRVRGVVMVIVSGSERCMTVMVVVVVLAALKIKTVLQIQCVAVGVV